MLTTRSAPMSRLDQLRGALLDSVNALRHRRASEIPAGYIDDYVALNWLEWYGGALRLTAVGDNVSKQLAAAARAGIVK